MFKVAGVSASNGQYKVRFANDMTRLKRLIKVGHTDVEFLELPEAMDKAGVVKFLKQSPLYTRNPKYTEAIDNADVKYNSIPTVKVKKAAKPAPSLEAIAARGKTKVAAPAAEPVSEKPAAFKAARPAKVAAK